MVRVLVVDDNEQSLFLLAALLRANDFEVETAHDGAEAPGLRERNLRRW